jgi:hypothetical protein
VAGDLGTGIHIRFEDAASLQKVVPRELFVALKRVSRDFGLRFEMDSSRQFAQRLVNELESMRGAPGLRWTSVGRGMDKGRDCAFFHHPMGGEAVEAIRPDSRKSSKPTHT